MSLFVFTYVDIARRNIGMEKIFAFIVVNLNETYMNTVDDMGRAKEVWGGMLIGCVGRVCDRVC